jgi:hypothetical protein
MRFTLREMLLAVLVIALSLGWFVHYRQWQAERQSLILELVEQLDAKAVVTRE